MNPCLPSPCGPNAECQVRDDNPACSCIENYVGLPPNCRPECTINPECPPQLACMQQKCRDPCVGLCGPNAQCSVVNHHAICTCINGYTGNPFSACEQVPEGEYTTVMFYFFLFPSANIAICMQARQVSASIIWLMIIISQDGSSSVFVSYQIIPMLKVIMIQNLAFVEIFLKRLLKYYLLYSMINCLEDQLKKNCLIITTIPLSSDMWYYIVLEVRLKLVMS